jgi:hypothetical protein
MDRLTPEHISVENINGGRLAMHINEQLKELIADIADPNKPATAKRGLTINISLSPSKFVVALDGMELWQRSRLENRFIRF